MSNHVHTCVGNDSESSLLPQHDVLLSPLYWCVLGLAPVLVATDVASRGLDIKDITLVKLRILYMHVIMLIHLNIKCIIIAFIGMS